MQLLHLDSSVLGSASASRQLTAEIVARQRALHPGLDVVYRDLSIDPAMHLSGAHLAAFQGSTTTDASITADLHKGHAYLDELFASDLLVIGAPMYNLTVPTTLKAWIDRVSIAGKTFRYSAHGPQGLLLNKKAFIASTRGGLYAAGYPAAASEHQEAYLVDMLAFLGVVDVTVVRAEGLGLGPNVRNGAIAQALADIEAQAIGQFFQAQCR